jgi:cytochrome c
LHGKNGSDPKIMKGIRENQMNDDISEGRAVYQMKCVAFSGEIGQ